MNNMHEADIIIIGAGMVGLVLALALVAQNFRVIIVENKIPVLEHDQEQLTPRVSAINLATKQILQNLQLWQHLDAGTISSLQRLVVWDSIGSGKIEFDAKDIGVAELGSIIQNRALIKEAWQQLSCHPHAEIIIGQPLTLQSANGITIQLQEHMTLRAALCIGADGADSWVREQMQIKLQQRAYQQRAIIAVVTTELAHQHTGWQAFLPTGPLALLPLADLHHCAIVWSNTSHRAEELMQMSACEFECELNNAFGLQLGEIKFKAQRQSFSLMMRHATQYVAPHLALVGDAAHTLHPLAGQGVNLGFLDAACLVDCLVDAREKKQLVGSLKPLRRYERWRKGDNAEMILAMRFLNDLFSSESTFVVQARSLGFNAVDRFAILKKCFMQTATRPKIDAPSLAKIN